MKVLHTSDWHLGHKLYEHDRHDEQAHMLTQIAKVVQTEQPDALVISGDIYHTSNPSKQTQKLFHDKLLEIQDAAPKMQIVVSSGNHDSSLGLEVARSLWDRCGIRICSLFERQDEILCLDRHIVEVCCGEELFGYIVAIPFAHPANFPKVLGYEAEGDQRQIAFVRAVLDLVHERNTKGLPVILMAHLFVKGSASNQHDNIGGLDYINLDDFGKGYDYLALGHIHRPHSFTSEGQLRGRYCGSPLALSFDEDFKHSVSIINFEGHCPQCRTIELPPLCPLITYPQKPIPFDELLKDLEDYAKQLKQVSYLRLHTSNYSWELPPDAAERISRILNGTQGKYCLIKANQTEARIDTDKHQSLSVQELKDSDPMDIAEAYYLRIRNKSLSQSLAKRLKEAILSTQQHN